MKPILAFMQNMWLKNPSTFWERYNRLVISEGREKADSWRLCFIETALFFRCITGKRLQATFGEDLIEQIVWEESTRSIGSTAKKSFPADLTHMRQAIAHHQPKIIVTFGKVAGDALGAVWHGASERCVHPAARGAHVIEELTQTARRLRDYVRLTA